jgi:uncharacterized protein involved in exopolysaccharide biosynthesis
VNPRATLDQVEAAAEASPRWLVHAAILWQYRRALSRITVLSLVGSLAVAFLIPKQYKSSASIMPPDPPNPGAAMLAALAGHLGSVGALSLAGALPGGHSSAELFIDLLRSGTVSDHLIDRFDLQHVYRKRYRVDTAKRLARLTRITENKKSGVITIEVEDTSRERARALAQAYLDELNQLVVRTNTSSAHRERVFIEQRLHDVQASLEEAEIRLSRFASNSTAIDIKEQTHAMLDAGARTQSELMIEQSGLDGLRQMYGDSNVRVRESEARIASLESQLTRMAGSPSANAADGVADAPRNATLLRDPAPLYPSLRQLPQLAVPYADLYRSVQEQEVLSQLLAQQYETARIEEAKDIPAVSIIDSPGLPEKKAFPPRLLLALLLTSLSFVASSSFFLLRHYWTNGSSADPRKEFAREVASVLRRRFASIVPQARGVT